MAALVLILAIFVGIPVILFLWKVIDQARGLGPSLDDEYYEAKADLEKRAQMRR